MFEVFLDRYDVPWRLIAQIKLIEDRLAGKTSTTS